MRVDHLTQQVESTEKRAAPPPRAAPKAAAEAGTAPATPEKTTYHTVEAGDTLYSISRKNGVSVEALRKSNDLRPGEAIRIGQKLVIPK
jgi:membrane-bound lytic murein transglycosylase D